MNKTKEEQQALFDEFCQKNWADPKNLSPGQKAVVCAAGLEEFIPAPEPISPSASTLLWVRTEMEDVLGEGFTLPSELADPGDILEGDPTIPDGIPRFSETELMLSQASPSQSPENIFPEHPSMSAKTFSEEPTVFFHMSAQTAPLLAFQSGPVPEHPSSTKTIRKKMPLPSKARDALVVACSASIFMGGFFFKTFLDRNKSPKQAVAQQVTEPVCPPRNVTIATMVPPPCKMPPPPAPPPPRTITLPVLPKKHRKHVVIPAAPSVEFVYKFRTGGFTELAHAALSCGIVPEKLIALPANQFVRQRLAQGIAPAESSYMRLPCPTSKTSRLEGETMPF